MKLNKVIFRLLLCITVLLPLAKNAQAQNGDQILDGIGETDMVARYVFNGDVKDWSRNTLHGKLQGDAQFIADDRFGKVLSLSGTNGFITLPGEALTDLESISISGWINLRTSTPGQYWFDFGQDAGRHFFAAPTGTKTQPGFDAAMLTTQRGNKSANVIPALATNQWLYLAVVADIPSGTITTYINGKQAGQTKGTPKEMTAIFRKPSAKKQLYIGKSISNGDTYLNALLHDFRIYRVPLSSSQVAGIYNHASGNQQATVNTSPKTEDDLERFPSTEPQLYNAYLTQVADVMVKTEAGS